ncbi:putative ribonuclease H-like domain-containing protein, partial [Tanacetum coccineum]
MSLHANDDFSQHVSDDEASYHNDASDNGDAPNKPKQQQQVIPTTTTILNIKLLLLKKKEYDMWAMEMEHYLEYIDNEVWKAVEKERKARTILLMSIPKEHLRRFHGMDDAKEIWEAIRTRFGGNANSKKMQKVVFKQQFEAFSISSSEGLEKGYDRFQQLLSQLEAHGAEVSNEDANHKFLRSLPPAWSNLAMTMRTKPNVDTLSIDDLYNNLRVFESEIKGASKASASTQNVAFVSQSKSSTSKVKSGYPTAYSPSTSSNNKQEKEVHAGFANKVIYSLFATQSEDLDLLHEHLEQIDDVDIEEMYINWQIAMIAIGMKKFYKKTECTSKGTNDGKKRDSFYQDQGAGKQEKTRNCLLTMDDGIVNWEDHSVEDEEPNHALMAISSTADVSLCSKICTDLYHNLKELCDEQTNQLGEQEAKILAYALPVKDLEAQVVTFQQQHLSLSEKLTFQANEIYAKDEKLKKYRRIGMKAVKEKEQLQKMVDSWNSSSKNLRQLVDSGMTSNNKVGLGYEIRSNNEVLSYEEEMNHTVFKVPHPLNGDYTPKPQEDIDDSLYVYGKHGPQKPETSVSGDNSTEHSTCQSNDSEGSFRNPSGHSSESESEPISVQNEMSTSKPVKINETVVSESISIEVEPSCNAMMERELREGYSFTKKKCFVCGSLSHLIKDCDFYEKKMAREAELKKQRVFNTGSGVVKPVWTNANRVNHTNHFIPRPVQLNAVRPNINSVRPNFNTGRAHVNSVRATVNTGRQNINTVRSKQPAPTKNTNSFSPGNWGTAVKTSVGYTWRKSGPNFNYNSGSNFVRTVNDHLLKNMGDRGIFNSGCSGHMTGNKDNLEDFEEFKGGSVTFGGSKCYITDFKMPDENQILLKVPRQHNMYSFDMKIPALSKDYACLIAKATSDKSKLWHRRLGHINFKNLNTLVKGNLVRGLPSKVFRNDHACVACHKGTDKTKITRKQSKISKHGHKKRKSTQEAGNLKQSVTTKGTCKFDLPFAKCISSSTIVTTAVLFQLHFILFSWVFFLGAKDETSGILQNFIRQIENQLNHRNGVAERMNRTLIEAARTMPANSLLPTTFWAEAVSTACYIFNRCDEGFLVGYSLNNKAYRVYNLVTKKVEVNLYVNFLEEKPNVKGVGTSVVTNHAGSLQTLNDQASEEDDEAVELMVVPTAVKYIAAKVRTRKHSIDSKEEECLTELQSLKAQEKGPSPTGISKVVPEILTFRRELEAIAQKHLGAVPDDNTTSTTSVNTGSGAVNTGKFDATHQATPDDSDMPELEIFHRPQDGIFDKASYDAEGVVHDFNN